MAVEGREISRLTVSTRHAGDGLLRGLDGWGRGGAGRCH